MPARLEQECATAAPAIIGVSRPAAVNPMALIAAAHAGEIDVLDWPRFGGA